MTTSGSSSAAGVNLTPSLVASYRRCPKQYAFEYVEKVEPPPRPSRPDLVTGTLLHGVLRVFFLRPVAQRTRERLLSDVEQAFFSQQEQFADRTALDHWLGLARRMAGHLAELIPLDAEPFLLEQTITLNLTPRLSLLGKIDRLDEDGEALVVIEYKTGRRARLRDLRSAPQSVIYPLLVQQHFRRPVKEVCYLFLREGRKVHLPAGQKEQSQGIKELLLLGERLRQQKAFPARTGPHCRFCPYLPLCPEGKQTTAC